MRGNTLTTRCVVAKKIRSIITKHSLNHFDVAEKWLYPMPVDVNHPEGQPVVLMVKDMQICNRQKTKRKWNKVRDPKIVEELYQVLGRGLGSAFLTGNVPYSKSKKFVFIDTEYAKRKIKMYHVDRFLSKKMRRHWNALQKQG